MYRRVLVTGAKGQLGREIEEIWSQRGNDLTERDFYFTDRNDLDISDKEAVIRFVREHEIDTIINCAAYTAVDRAETEEGLAFRVNRTGAENLAIAAKGQHAFLIHISTDYVFDGRAFLPLVEDAKTNPEGVYGCSKLAGEEAIREIAPEGAVIIRTSWVYSTFGQNFVHTMLRLGRERDELGVVCDQIGTPTYARDLARAIFKILEEGSKHPEKVEAYHYSNEGCCSWYDFAQAIFEISKTPCKVRPIGTCDYPTPAKRPHYTVLSKEKIKKEFGVEVPYWRDALKECLTLIVSD